MHVQAQRGWPGAFLLAAAVALLPACVTVKPVDYSWSFESVMNKDAAGVYRAEPKTLAFDATEIFREETGKKDAVADRPLRVIRDAAGFYYVTAPGFRHVFVLEGGERKLTLEKKILVDPDGMEKPFFNQRERGIELVADGQVRLLNKKGIIPEGKQ